MGVVALEPREAASRATGNRACRLAAGSCLSDITALWWTQNEEAKWDYLLKNVLQVASMEENEGGTHFSFPGVCSAA